MGMPGKLEIFLEEVGRKPFTALLRGPAQAGASGAVGDVLLAVGTTVPAGGTAGFAKGAAFFKTDPVTAGILEIHSNAGTALSCNFTRTDA